jgi:hypothetical protein
MSHEANTQISNFRVAARSPHFVGEVPEWQAVDSDKCCTKSSNHDSITQNRALRKHKFLDPLLRKVIRFAGLAAAEANANFPVLGY